mgnify:FL=1
MPRKSNLYLAMACVVFLSYCILVSSAWAQPESGGNVSLPMVSVSPHVKEHPPNAFRGERKALGADLFAFKFAVYGAEFQSVRLAFRIHVDVKEGKSPKVENYTIWKDEDGDGRVNSTKDKKLSSGVVEDGYLIFSESFTFSTETSLIVRADFLSLSPGTFFAISFDHEKSVVKRGDTPAKFFFTTTLRAAEHYESYPAMEVRASSLSSAIVGNQRLTIYVDVSYLRGVEPFWGDIDKVIGWISDRPPVMNEVEGFDLLRRRIILSFAQPKDMPLGIHKIPSLTIRYRDTAVDSNIVHKVSTNAFTIRKERAVAETNVLVRRIAIGDPIFYELRIMLDPAYTVPNDYIGEMRVREFSGGFKIWDAKTRILEGEGERVVEYLSTISYVGVPAGEVLLPSYKIPYVKIGELSREMFFVISPEIRFPFNSVVIGKNFAPIERWRSIRREELTLFGYAVGDWMIVAPMFTGGGIVLFFLGSAMISVARRRRIKHTSLLGRIRVRRRAIRALGRGYSSEVAAYNLSLAIREYVGVAAGISPTFALSASFRPWLRKRYPMKDNLYDMLTKVERTVIEEGHAAKTILLSYEREALIRALKYVGRMERARRIKEKMRRARTGFSGLLPWRS